METIKCLVCHGPMDVGPARGRKSGKPFVMLKCRRRGQHFRAFIGDETFVNQLIEAAATPPAEDTATEEPPDPAAPSADTND